MVSYQALARRRNNLSLVICIVDHHDTMTTSPKRRSSHEQLENERRFRVENGSRPVEGGRLGPSTRHSGTLGLWGTSDPKRVMVTLEQHKPETILGYAREVAGFKWVA